MVPRAATQNYSGIKYFLYFFLRFYVFIHERHRQRNRQRKKQAPCQESDAGLDTRTPGSQLEPKADAQSLSHPGTLNISF